MIPLQVASHGRRVWCVDPAWVLCSKYDRNYFVGIQPSFPQTKEAAGGPYRELRPPLSGVIWLKGEIWARHSDGQKRNIDPSLARGWGGDYKHD